MPSCRVNECSNRSGGGVRLFSIPKRSRDVEVAKKWLKSVWDKELDDDQFALLMKEEFRVCAEHFVESDFDARGKLKADAVPSRFPWNGGQQRASAISKTKNISSEHKSNGSLVNKLTRALKAAETIVDGEIKDIDKWIVQLEAQVDHLRSKREKLVQHKADLGRSLGQSPIKLSELCSPRGQSSLNFIMNNGTNYYNTTTNNNNNNPGESLILSNAMLAAAETPEQSQRQRINQLKPVRRTADDIVMTIAERYLDNGDARLFMPVVPTPPESGTEAISLSNKNVVTFPEQTGFSSAADVTSSSAHVTNHRQFATRRKNFKPTRRIDLASRAMAVISSSETAGDVDDKISLPSSSTAAIDTPQTTVSVKAEEDDNRGMECEGEPSSGQQCDLTAFSQTQ